MKQPKRKNLTPSLCSLSFFHFLFCSVFNLRLCHALKLSHFLLVCRATFPHNVSDGDGDALFSCPLPPPTSLLPSVLLWLWLLLLLLCFMYKNFYDDRLQVCFPSIPPLGTTPLAGWVPAWLAKRFHA